MVSHKLAVYAEVTGNHYPYCDFFGYEVNRASSLKSHRLTHGSGNPEVISTCYYCIHQGAFFEKAP
jgi:hypothetical protein